MKVILGVDGSAGSLAAVQFASRVLSPQRDQILLYYTPPHLSMKYRDQPDPAMLARVAQTLADAVFEQARAALGPAIAERVDTLVGTQAPAQGILIATEAFRADLLVLGARGSGPVHSNSVGSVTRAAVHHCNVPVLVVRADSVPDPDAPLHVLLASDGLEGSRRAGEFLNHLEWRSGDRGRVITVIESLLEGHIPEWLEQQVRNEESTAAPSYFQRQETRGQQVRAELQNWIPELPNLFHEQEPLVSVGHSSAEILKAIAEFGIHLAVIGPRELGPLGRLLLGSTSEHLLTHAPCSLLLVRQHPRP